MCYTGISNGKVCQCPKGFTGTFCETSICKSNEIHKGKNK